MRFLAFLIVGLLWGVTTVRAEDRKHVALLEFDGPRSATVRGDVMRIVATKAWISSASKLDGRSLREFADDYEIDLIVQGTVSKHGSDYEVRVTFVRGANGQSIRRATASVRTPALDKAARERVERELARALAAVSGQPHNSAP